MYFCMLAFEQFRIWARGCKCRKVEPLQGKTVECCWKSRRLPELASRVDLMARQLSGIPDKLTLEPCEGDAGLLMECDSFLGFGSRPMRLSWRTRKWAQLRAWRRSRLDPLLATTG